MNCAQTVPMFGEDDVPPDLRPFIDVLLNGDVRGVFDLIGCPKDTDEHRLKRSRMTGTTRHSNQQPSESQAAV